MNLAPLNRLAVLASQRSDVVIAAFMMLAVVMMIIPLPTVMVDALIAVNIAFSLLVLVVAFYVRWISPHCRRSSCSVPCCAFRCRSPPRA
jgi:type III secretory pathway component EscV